MNVLRRTSFTILVAGFVLVLHCLPFAAPIFELNCRESKHLVSYRIITCHALHWSWNHLAWDLLMFTVLGAICESVDRLKYFSYLLLAGILIPNVVIACHPELSSYRGLSGLDSGLFSMLAVDRMMCCLRKKDRVGVLVFSACLFCLVIKLVGETCYGGNLFVSDSSFVPVPISHLIGAVVGAMVCLIFHEQPERKLNDTKVGFVIRDQIVSSSPISNWPTE